MKARSVLILALLLAPWCGFTDVPAIGGSHASSARGQGGQEWVEVTEGLVTIDARGAAVAEILADLTDKTGIQLSLEAPLTGSTTIILERVTLPEALSTLLSGQNFVLRYSRRHPMADGLGVLLPDKLWVFPLEKVMAPAGGGGAVIPHAATPAEGPLHRLSRQMDHEDPRIRLDALVRFSDMEDSGAEEIIADAAMLDLDPAVREEAVQALAELAGEYGLPVLEMALRDRSPRVREAALDAVTDVGGEAGARTLALAYSGGDGALREAAVLGLGEIGGQAALEVLREALEDRELQVREAAADALEDLYDQLPSLGR